MINNLILNEKKYVENFIKTKDLQGMNNFNFLLKLLIRYYIQYGKLNNDKSRIKNKTIRLTIIELTKGLKENYLEEYQLDKKIKNLINRESKKNIKLKELSNIPLRQSELDKIKSCKTNREKKILFTCYILSEFFNNEWINISYTDLFKLANISMSQKDQCIFIGDMVDKGFIGISYINTNLSLKILMDKKGEEVFSIDNVKNLGNKIIAFLKTNYIVCQQCGKLVKIKSKNDHSTKYCKDCADRIESESSILRKRKQREREKCHESEFSSNPYKY